LSELLDEIAGEPVQVEVSAVRVLFELLGFLLKSSSQPSAVSFQFINSMRQTVARRTKPQGLKPKSFLWLLTARLKPCPSTNQPQKPTPKTKSSSKADAKAFRRRCSQKLSMS